MPVIIERIGIDTNLGVSGNTLNVPFLIKEAPLRIDAHAALQAYLPAYYIEAGMTLTFQDYDLRELGAGCWEAEAHYSRQEPRGDNSGPGGGQQGSNPFEMQSGTFSFETQGGTVHRTKSLSTISSTFGAPDFQGAINVNNETVQGVDIETPGFSWQETHFFPRFLITPTYIDRLWKLGQSVNNASWTSFRLGITFQAGEVRFRYCSGGPKDNDQFEITYHFHAERNQTAIVIGENTIDKKGQDLLWIRYQDAENANVIVSRPHHAYVEQVYPYIDFADLEP